MRRIHLVVAALLTLAPMTGFIQAQAQSTGFAPRPAESGAQAFAVGAATASQFAIAASQQVLKRSVDRKVKKLAEGIIADYQAEMKKFIELCGKLEAALKANNNAEAEKLCAAMGDTQMAGHKQYKKDDKKKK